MAYFIKNLIIVFYKHRLVSLFLISFLIIPLKSFSQQNHYSEKIKVELSSKLINLELETETAYCNIKKLNFNINF